MCQLSIINFRFRFNENAKPGVIPEIHILYHAIICLLGPTFTLTFAVTRTLALAITFMMIDVCADAAHVHGHAITQSTTQSSTA